MEINRSVSMADVTRETDLESVFENLSVEEEFRECVCCVGDEDECCDDFHNQLKLVSLQR